MLVQIEHGLTDTSTTKKSKSSTISNANFSWIYATCCVLFTVLLCTLFNFEQHADYSKLAIFIAVSIVMPIASALTFTKISNTLLNNEDLLQKVLFINLTIILVGSSWYIATIYYPDFYKFNIYLLIMSFSLLIFSLIFQKTSNQSKEFNKIIQAINKGLICIAPLTLTIATVIPLERWGVSFSTSIGIIVTAIFAATICISHFDILTNIKSSESNIKWITNVIVLLSALLTIDLTYSYDILHYTAYLGPAVAVKAGRIPLQDVFCQYGLSYLLYNIGFNFLPLSYSSAALITSLANSAYILCSLSILRKLIKSHFTYLVFGLTLPYFYWLTYSNSAASLTPSHGGLRYLPIFFLAMSLIWMKPKKNFSPLSIFALFICWAWSFEAALYSTAIYSFFLVASSSVSGEKNLKEVFRSSAVAISKLFTIFLIFILAFCIIYLIFTKQLPRYDLYLSLVMSYIGPNPFMDYKSYIMSGFYTWLIVIVSYSLAVTLVIRQCINPTPSNVYWIPKLAILAALGITTSIYCLLGTVTHTFRPVILPFYLLMYWTVDMSITQRRSQRHMFTFSELGLIPIILYLAYILSGAAGGNFLQKTYYGSPNSIAIKQIFDIDFKLGNLKQQLGILKIDPVCNNQVQSLNICTNVLDEELVLIAKWQGMNNSLMTFYPENTYANILFKKPQTLPVSMSYVDGFSPALFNFILSKSRRLITQGLNVNQTIIVHNNIKLLNNLEIALLKEITSVWEIQKIDESGNLSVYKLNKKITDNVSYDLLGLSLQPINTRNTL